MNILKCRVAEGEEGVVKIKKGVSAQMVLKTLCKEVIMFSRRASGMGGNGNGLGMGRLGGPVLEGKEQIRRGGRGLFCNQGRGNRWKNFCGDLGVGIQEESPFEYQKEATDNEVENLETRLKGINNKLQGLAKPLETLQHNHK